MTPDNTPEVTKEPADPVKDADKLHTNLPRTEDYLATGAPSADNMGSMDMRKVEPYKS